MTLSIHRIDAVAADADVVVYFEVEDVDAVVSSLKKDGLTFESEPADQEWRWREAYLRDPDKH